MQTHGYRYAALICLSVSLSASVSGADTQNFNPAFFRAPPKASKAAYEILSRPIAAGNAVLRVEFADQRKQTPIAIRNGVGTTLLRDDGMFPDTRAGDGVYAAVVTLNLQQIYREQQRRVSLANRVQTVPVFSMRELTGHERFSPSPARLLRPGDRGTFDRFLGVPITVDSGKELIVTHPSVVEDPSRTFDVCTGAGTPLGAWTFGRLMTEIANEPDTGIRPGDFVEHWIQQWTVNLTINTFTVFNRATGAQRLLDHWPRLPDGQLDLAAAPFRLLAIVNRQDLRENVAYGGTGGGEARLVFGALNCNEEFVNGGEAAGFTVIFEYGIAANTCPAVKSWAQQWHALGGLALGSAAYNTALQAITDQFTLRDANPSKVPNRSAINQIRTNEFAFMGAEAFWDLRESRLSSCGLFCPLDAGELRHMTVAQTPHVNFGSTPAGRTLLTNFINSNEGSILAGAHQVGLTLPTGEHFRGGNIEPGSGSPWNPGMVTNLEARHRFSKATCNGCHVKEVDADFLHIAPRAAGVASELSDFLTGNDMPKLDPVSGVARVFHELADRQQKLDVAANMSCLTGFDFPVEEIFLEPVPPAFAH